MLVPGSHTWEKNRRPHRHEIIQAAMPAGSILIIDGSILHAGGGNTTAGQNRRTININYSRGWLRTQFNSFVSVPRETVLALPQVLQRDLGYHVSTTGLGMIDMVEPIEYLRRLRKAGGDGAQGRLGWDAKYSKL
eukprot:gnl/TRDRNA2_/TRDRNA2_155982_c1_seq1.p2 gnl/TRDRNA2_/TRDRNA2_155982_c1~~gnl/TRDRNA2_/TRDRNA2_155982_c1_seq1.p2  ORF type:complete len:135 (-),score=13.76 gnl/TRDRNA2_/TRDRNA2_155982_c1_seq1:35-439(-)